MTKKDKSVAKKDVKAAKATKLDERKQLLARVAGSVAAGVMASPSESAASADGVAAIAVDIAEAILQKIGV